MGLSLRELEQEGLIERKVVETKPVQVYYRLTSKGTRVAKCFRGVEKD